MALYSWRADRKATKECISYFVRRALADKVWALSVTEAWKKGASDISLKMQKDYASQSVKQMARHSLEYARLRAFLGTGSKEGGSYCPAGYPWDRPANQLWKRLNQSAGGKHA